MVVVEVADIQQVTTRSKGKMTEWEAQESIQTTEWIEKANVDRPAKELKEVKTRMWKGNYIRESTIIK